MKNNKRNEWKGFTTDELRLHRAINSVKLEMEKERFSLSLNSAKKSNFGKMGSFFMDNFGTLSKGIGIATATFSIIKKLRSVIKR